MNCQTLNCLTLVKSTLINFSEKREALFESLFFTFSSTDVKTHIDCENKKGGIVMCFKLLKKLAASISIMVLTLSLCANTSVNAAKKPYLKEKEVTVRVKRPAHIRLINAKGPVRWKILSGKNKIKLARAKNSVFKMIGKKTGTVKIMAIYKKKKYVATVKILPKREKKTQIKPPKIIVYVDDREDDDGNWEE